MKSRADTFELDLSVRGHLGDDDSGPGGDSNRVKCKQAGKLCQGLRWAAWDAVMGASGEGEGVGIAGARAREIIKCSGGREHDGKLVSGVGVWDGYVSWRSVPGGSKRV